MKRIMYVVLLAFAVTAHAAIYMQKDKNGNILYTDTPTENSQELNLNESNSLSQDDEPETTNETPTQTTPPPTNNATPPVTPNASPLQNNMKPAPSSKNVLDQPLPDQHKPYTTFTVDSPKDQETIQNQPIFNVTFKTDPELQPGDTIQAFVDGKAMGSPVTGTQVSLENVDRGTHTLYGEILDRNKTVVSTSNTVTIFVHRASANFNPASNNVQPPAPAQSIMKSMLSRVFG